MELDVDIEELIDALLIEIAFSGVRGCSVSALLKKIGSFYNVGPSKTGNPPGERRGEGDELNGVDGNTTISNHESHIQQNPSNYDISIGSEVWGWLVVRSDVSVGSNRRFNHLSLDEILALPEEQDPEPSTDDIKSTSNQTSTPVKDKRRAPKNSRDVEETTGKFRPRLYVSEERQWKTLAGHGPDSKRIPLFEWKALVDIASTRENGILQGDLVRLSGQDKRSLPTRTDSLAKKGYIIKQPIILRGCRSSKLWLAKFSESAKMGRDGLNFNKVDLSKEALTKDLAPVPFSACWNGERLDYIAVAQAFNAVLKAWEIMRYCDMRTKLDTRGVPQMRALAKTSRWFTNIGAATFVAARFANGQRLFKDCIKFIREPTAEEWRVFRTTPSAHIKVPSARLGKRGQASRARYSKGKGAQPSPHSQAKMKKTPKTERPAELMSHEEPISLLWNPYEPMVNTAFKIIERAGSNGSSNAKVGRITLGHTYRKYVAALTAVLSQSNSQPSHLQHLDVISQLTRLGKTMTYQFFSSNNQIGGPSSGLEKDDEAQNQETGASKQTVDGNISRQDLVVPLNKFEFSKPLFSRIAKTPKSSFYHINRTIRKSTPKWGGKRKRLLTEELGKETSTDNQKPPSKMPRVEESPSIIEGDEERERPAHDQETDFRIDEFEVVPMGSLREQSHDSELPSPSVSLPTPPRRPSRPPGVYREPDNMLDPPGKKGRRKKSLVIAFRHDALKNPSFLKRHAGNEDDSVPQTGLAHPADSSQSASASLAQGDSTISGVLPAEPKRKAGRGGKPEYRCDKCGNSWKNSNGLEYHLNRSRSTCNPTFVPPPIVPPKPPRQLPKPKPVPRAESSAISDNQNQARTRNSLQRQSLDLNVPQDTPDVGNRRVLPSKRTRPHESLTLNLFTEDLSGMTSVRGSVTLQNLEAYDIIDHRRRRGNGGQVATPSASAMASQLRQASQASPQVKEKRPFRTNEQGSILSSIPGEHVNVVPKPKPDSIASSLKPTVSGSLEKGVRSSTTNHSVAACTTGDGQGSTTIVNQSSQDIQYNQKYTPKKTPKRSNPTVGTLRRERTNHIILHLLDNNDGVFPGQRSVYQAMVSIWAKRHHDIEPPDWKVCQNVVNRMEKAGTLIQMHFCFLNEKGKLEECVVLGKSIPGETDAVKLAAEPKVVIMKEKMREMFPEPYIPEAFSLSQEEGELFDALASRHKDNSQSNDVQNLPRKSSITEDVEVLQYPAHVMVDVAANATSLKRPMNDDVMADTSPTKRIRIDASITSKPPSAFKIQNRHDRRDHREYWEAGKVAKYIWNQSQIEKWSYKTACLQDFSTGAWSVLPQGAPSLQFDINKALSSSDISRENGLISKLRGRNTLKATGKVSRAKPKKQSGSATQNSRSPGGGDQEFGNEAIIGGASEHRKLAEVDRFVKPSISTSFVPDDSISDDEDEDTIMVDAQHDGIADEDLNAISNEASTKFAKHKAIQSNGSGYWPSLSSSFFEKNSSFALLGNMPSTKWFIRENLPQCAGDIIKTFRGKFQFNSWADPLYGKFLREVSIIEEWEKSPDGSQILLHGSIIPDFDCIFISLSPDISRASMQPIARTLEWPRKTQYTAENLPDDIKDSPPDDENAGVSIPIRRNRGRPRKDSNVSPSREKVKPRVPKTPRKVQPEIIPRVEIQYKTRQFGPIPVLHRGRVNRPAPSEDKLGLNGETDLIAAFVVFKTLLGGVEKKVDIGLILKTFPQYSHSFLRKFWPRVSKERKTYIDALTKKFQSSFIEAYEKGEVKPLNYDDLDSYDWRSLVIWATKLETHENVNLPESRRALEGTYWLEDQVNEIRDWRETWFQSLASIYSRVEATASKPVSIPLGRRATAEEELISRARSWVRSLCITPITHSKMPEEIRAKLLKLIDRNEAEANKLLKKVVDQLTSERIAARSKGKIFGQALRLHGVFAKQLEKAPTVEKFYQAINFKASLDQAFRNGEEYIVPYLANDGTILAIINLQAHGRVRVESIGAPNIPFGFEPGNYDGRTFPKTYYHFSVKLLPTETYLFDDDLPVLHLAMRMEPPKEGPRDEIPIWVDFFGNLNKGRWITYLGMMVLGMATKGPLTPETASVLMKPFVEPFEAKLIMDWSDRLGILQRLESDNSATVGEWWWLVVGKLAQGYREEVNFSELRE
ncbi:uncharacterized protein GGS22DRAFT_195469 [Annulohypoxylon maeteangense]|uniref:uncharacterized protein n=1 Tax=Annulohypoxylon maeteangense TaxID=1927788 RepID=UPI0020081E22|nr:uncharacterized protein GGS22DRAFT_195469 [Annulohypoxylon maeteangense]KAI0883305.1 hypothetical protein GGS22DRAFT_195469 [Annulohypoxylon maeteangense]